MIEDSLLDGVPDGMELNEWIAALEEHASKYVIICKLKELCDERNLLKKKPEYNQYTYLDAVARPGCHVGFTTVRP